MFNLIKFLNKVKVDNIIAEMEDIKSSHSGSSLILSFDFSCKTVTILCEGNSEYTQNKSFSIKKFNWFEIENLIEKTGDENYGVSMEETDFPKIQEIIEGNIKSLFKKNKVKFSGYTVKKYRTEKEYNMEIGEYAGNFNSLSAAMTFSKELVLIKEVMAVNISIKCNGKTKSIFNFEFEDIDSSMLFLKSRIEI